MEHEQKPAAPEMTFDILKRTMPFQVVSDGMLQKIAVLGQRDVYEQGTVIYDVGDSTNDALMFEHFEHSIGVANVRRFASALSHLPRYVAQAERGAGFAEVAAAVLDARPGINAR